MAPSEADTAAAVQDTKGGHTLSRAGRALRALRTDTVEGHGQMAYKSSDPTKQELRGRSMRAKLPSWRSRMDAEECDASPRAPPRMKARSLRAPSALQAPSERPPKPKIVRRPATMHAAIERIKQERAEAARAAEVDAALKAAALEAAELKAAELKEAARAAAAELKAAKEAEALRAARTLLVAEEAPTAKEARHIEQKKALAAALAEIDAALEQSTLLQTPRPSVSTLMETQTRAEGPAGQNAKYSSACKVVENRWDLFCLIYEDEFKLKEGDAPTLEMAKAFVTYSFSTRLRGSREGKEGRGDSTDGQHRYLLCQHVWPHKGYAGWVGLSRAELKAKAELFTTEMHELWGRLCQANPQMSTKESVNVKTKWSELSYKMAQDKCLDLFEKGKQAPAEVITRLAVIGFVRATCARSGSFAKDWWDRSGATLEWMEKNVMSLEDLLWAREGMTIVLGEDKDGQEVMEDDALRAEAAFNRLKHHYDEKYHFDMSMTADMTEPARRGSTMMFIYLFMRGCFAVQYEGMSAEAVTTAVEARKNGVEVGMPPGAAVSAPSAMKEWMAGRRTYLPALRKEPLFVKLKAKGKSKLFTVQEMNTEYIGSTFKYLGEQLGFKPGASGLNSGRRMAMVSVQKGAEKLGYDSAMHAKHMASHLGKGHECRETVYADHTNTFDVNAFQMGRAPMEMEGLKDLALTRVPELAKFGKTSDVPKDDPLRETIVEKNEVVVKLKASLTSLDAILEAIAQPQCEAAARQNAILEQKRAMLRGELRSVTARLETQLLHKKRQQVWEAGVLELESMPLEEVKKRQEVRDLSKESVVSMACKLLSISMPKEEEVSVSAGKALTGATSSKREAARQTEDAQLVRYEQLQKEKAATSAMERLLAETRGGKEMTIWKQLARARERRAAKPLQLVLKFEAREMSVTCKGSALLATVISECASQLEKLADRLRLCVDGERLCAEKTVEQSGLVDGAEVDVFEEKDGGAPSLKEAAAGCIVKEDESGDLWLLMEERPDLEGTLVSLSLCGEREGDKGPAMAFVGGKKEPGESSEGCLRREVKDETSIVVGKDPRLLEPVEANTWLVRHWLCLDWTGEPIQMEPEKGHPLRWVRLRTIESENLSKSAWLVLPQLMAAIGEEKDGYASGGTELDYMPEGGTQPDGVEEAKEDEGEEEEHPSQHGNEAEEGEGEDDPSQQDSPISLRRAHEKKVAQAAEAGAAEVTIEAAEAAAELETAERARTAVASAPVLEMERTPVPSLVPTLEPEAASTAMVPAPSVESEKSLEEMKASLNAILGQTSALLSKWTDEVQRDPADHEPLPLKEQGGEQSDELEEQRSAEASVQPLEQEVERLQGQLAVEELELKELKARLAKSLARLDDGKDGEDKQGAEGSAGSQRIELAASQVSKPAAPQAEWEWESRASHEREINLAMRTWEEGCEETASKISQKAGGAGSSLADPVTVDLDTSELDAAQLEVVQLVTEKEACVCLNGKAGTGKSKVIAHIVMWFYKRGRLDELLLVCVGWAQLIALKASIARECGKSVAMRAEFCTLSKAAGVHVGEPWEVSQIVAKVRVEERACTQRLYGERTKLLIFDEIGKADSEQIDVTNEVAKVLKSTSAALGGVRFLFVGDGFQLPPSFRLKPSDGKDFFWEARLFEEERRLIVFRNLVMVRRQKCARTVNALQQIKYGLRTPETDAFFLQAMSVDHESAGVSPYEVQHVWYANWMIEKYGAPQYMKMAAFSGDTYWKFDAVGPSFHYGMKTAFKWKFAFSIVLVVGARYRFASHSETEEVTTVTGETFELKQAQKLTCKGWNEAAKTVFLQVDGVETEPIVKLSLKRWWATWVYGSPPKEKMLQVDALPLTYAMATTPDASQGEGYEYLHFHTKSIKADNRNMVYMCASRCIKGPWENGLRMDAQPLEEVYDVMAPHHKSVLFEVEELKVADVPAEAVERARRERDAKKVGAPPGVAAALAAQEAAAAKYGKRKR